MPSMIAANSPESLNLDHWLGSDFLSLSLLSPAFDVWIGNRGWPCGSPSRYPKLGILLFTSVVVCIDLCPAFLIVSASVPTPLLGAHLKWLWNFGKGILGSLDHLDLVPSAAAGLLFWRCYLFTLIDFHIQHIRTSPSTHRLKCCSITEYQDSAFSQFIEFQKGSPYGILWSPHAILGSPNGIPRSAHDEILGSPNGIPVSLHDEIPGSPHDDILGSPHDEIPRSPHEFQGSPNGIPGSPHEILGSLNFCYFSNSWFNWHLVYFKSIVIQILIIQSCSLHQ